MELYEIDYGIELNEENSINLTYKELEGFNFPAVKENIIQKMANLNFNGDKEFYSTYMLDTNFEKSLKIFLKVDLEKIKRRLNSNERNKAIFCFPIEVYFINYIKALTIYKGQI